MNISHELSATALPFNTEETECEHVIDITSAEDNPATRQSETMLEQIYVPEIIVWLDSASIRSTALPNRDPATFDSDAFYALEQSILQSRGNLQPIKVRRVLSEDGNGIAGKELFEVVYGHRRLHACQSLGIKVRAVVVDHLGDRAVLLERVRENMGRADMGPLDFGRICQSALAEKLFVSRKQMASAFGRDEGDVSKALSLAGLPPEVISAFESTADLQYRHSKPLKDALEERFDEVMAIALEIARKGGRRTPAVVLERLTRPAGTEIGLSKSPSKLTLLWDGKPYGDLKTTAEDKVTIVLKSSLDATAREDLQTHLHAFMKQQVAARAKATQRRNAQQAVKSVK